MCSARAIDLKRLNLGHCASAETTITTEHSIVGDIADHIVPQ